MGASLHAALLAPPAAAEAPDTAAPDLVSATLMPGNQVNVQQDVEFCFRGPTASQPNGDTIDTIDANRFYVRTYNSGLYIVANTVEKSQTDGKCVIAHFPTDIDLEIEGSVGEVDADPGLPAVRSINTKGNYYSSVPLTGSTLHKVQARTTGPDLVSVVQGSTTNLVRFIFDQTIDVGSPNFNEFYAVNGEGTVIPAVGVSTVDDAAVTDPTGTYQLKNNMVVVDFGQNVANLNRYGVDEDAVRTPATVNPPLGTFQPTQFTASPPAVVVKSTSGRPELQSAVPATGGQFRLTYNANVSSADATKIFAVFDNGLAFAPTNVLDWSPTQDAKQILVKFGSTPVPDEPGAVVKIVSGAGAVFSSDTIPRPAFPSEVPVGTGAPFEPGLTTGPDLVDVTASEQDRQVTFSFDEAVDPTAITPELFSLVSEDGTLSPAQPAVTPGVSGSDVVISFALSEVQAAKAVSVRFGAVHDPLGQPNVNNSISLAPPPVPTALADNVTVAKGGSADVSPLNNDTFTGQATVTVNTAALPAGVTASVNASNLVTITVSSTYSGAANVTLPYTVTDDGGSGTSTININITGLTAGQGPVAVDDTVTIDRGSNSTVDVLANDTVTGEASVDLGSVPQGITAFVTSEDEIFVQVGNDFSGSTAAIPYTVTDSVDSDSAVLTVTVPDGAVEVPTALTAKAKKNSVKGVVFASEGCDAGRDLLVKLGKKTLGKGVSLGAGKYTVKLKKAAYKKAKGKKIQVLAKATTRGLITCLGAKSSATKVK